MNNSEELIFFDELDTSANQAEAECCSISCEDLVTSPPISAGSCSDCITHNLGDMMSSSLGRLLEVRFRLRSICPGRRVIVALILYELTQSGLEIPRGFKVITLPAHSFQNCRNIDVRRIFFILPEDGQSLCNPSRRFFLRHTHHYLDFPGNCFNFFDQA